MKHSTLLFLATCVGLVMHAQVPSYVPTDGLVAWWNLDGAAIDDVGNNHGESFGTTPTFDRHGNENQAMDFDGGSHVSLNTFFDGLQVTEASYSLWFLAEESDDTQFISGKEGFWRTIYVRLSPEGSVRFGGTSGGVYFGVSSEDGAIEFGTWHHLVVTFENSQISLFLDGEALVSGPSSTSYLDYQFVAAGNSTATNYFGAIHPVSAGITGHFNGSLDEFGLWNRALTENEVLQLNDGEAPPFGCTDETACNYILQGFTASQYTDSLGYSIATLISSGYESANLIGMEYGGGLIYNIEEQEADLVISIVHPPEYADAPVPNMGLNPGSACGAGGQFGGSFLNAPEQCANLVLEGYDDWFLPTIDQVQQVYETLFYSAEFPVNVCATGASGYFKGVDYLSATETCRCYFGTGEVLCNAPAGNAYEYFPVRQTLIPALPPNIECEFGCEYCGPGTSWDAIAQMCVVATSPYLNDPGEAAVINPCYFDSDQSGIVDVTDLMNVLSVYGLACGDVPAAAFSCGDPVSYQGYDYETVLIGSQCWLAENLRSSYYQNGDDIPGDLSAADWELTNQNQSGACSIYGETDGSCAHFSPCIDPCDELASLEAFGKLYNWYAVNDGRNLCPSGWHVASDDEWAALEDDVVGQGFDSPGTALRSSSCWVQGNNGTDDVGFEAVPGGYRNAVVEGHIHFPYAGHGAYFWTASVGENSSEAWCRYFDHFDPQIRRESLNRGLGFSIRCVKD